jgi:hypothetical protein
MIKYINPLKKELVYIIVFSPYLKENTKIHHYKDQLVNAIQENNPVYTDTLTKLINTKCKLTDC